MGSPGKVQCLKIEDKSKLSNDKEPCCCSVTTTGESVDRKRLPSRKQAKVKNSGRTNKVPDPTDTRKAPEIGAATPRSAVLRKERYGFVRAAVKPDKEPLWCKIPKTINDVSHCQTPKTSKASALRYSNKNGASDTSSASKVIKVLWHATNYTDPE